MFPRSFLTSKASANVAISTDFLKRFGLPHCSVIYHGIDVQLQSAFPLDFANPSSIKICFAYIGRLIAEKGVSVLLEAARLLDEEGHSFSVRLIGDGPERSSLEAIITAYRLESRVQFTRFLNGVALAEAVRSVHVVVMPSVWEEPAGLAVIEQMMRGRLVIASDSGGLSEMVGDAGLKYLPGDARALAGAMRRVLLQPSLIEFLGKRAYLRAVEFFRHENMIAQHARVYREIRRDKDSHNLS